MAMNTGTSTVMSMGMSMSTIMSMDMSTSTIMSMDMATATGAAAAATSTAVGSMSMDMGDSSCKVSMLWNWYTIDACFIAKSWHITSSGMFAGSCIGVILLVMTLELLRRVSKEYDRYIIKQAERQLRPPTPNQLPSPAGSTVKGHEVVTTLPSQLLGGSSGSGPRRFRPNIFQQAIRAALHMLQFAVAYFIMLLAMYYNGYIIICIIIGAFLGAFVFSWESLMIGENKDEVTFCCG